MSLHRCGLAREDRRMFRETAHVYDLIYAAEGKDYLAESIEVRDQIVARSPNARSLLDVVCGTGSALGAETVGQVRCCRAAVAVTAIAAAVVVVYAVLKYGFSRLL